MVDKVDLTGDEEIGSSSIGEMIKNTSTGTDFIKRLTVRLLALSSTAEAIEVSDKIMDLSPNIEEKFGVDIQTEVHQETARILRAFQNN